MGYWMEASLSFFLNASLLRACFFRLRKQKVKKVTARQLAWWKSQFLSLNHGDDILSLCHILFVRSKTPSSVHTQQLNKGLDTRKGMLLSACQKLTLAESNKGVKVCRESIQGRLFLISHDSHIALSIAMLGITKTKVSSNLTPPEIKIPVLYTGQEDDVICFGGGDWDLGVNASYTDFQPVVLFIVPLVTLYPDLFHPWALPGFWNTNWSSYCHILTIHPWSHCPLSYPLCLEHWLLYSRCAINACCMHECAMSEVCCKIRRTGCELTTAGFLQAR